jgi:hypothetical protein
VKKEINESLDLSTDFNVEVGFPSEEFPLIPERMDSAATMSAISSNLIEFSGVVRQAGQTKLLLTNHSLSHLTKLNFDPADVTEAGSVYSFKIALK